MRSNLTVIVVEAPMEMELQQLKLVVKVTALHANERLHFVRCEADTAHNNSVSIVADVVGLSQVVVDELERTQAFVVLNILVLNINRRLLCASTSAEFMRPNINA